MASTLSLLTLHSLLDAAIAPQRGTAASDHLAATIVPLAVVALIASTYPRLRSGARAAVAACLGTWCLVGASLAVADARATFERVSDWTGFLLAPAGLALLALAIGLALSTRKGGRYRYLRRAGVTFGALVIAYWLVVPVSIGLIGTQRPRAAAAEMPVGYHSVSLRTTDGLHLAAWYAPSQNGAAVISFPTRSGKLDHRDASPPWIRRAHGRHAWIRRIRREPEHLRMGCDEGHRCCRFMAAPPARYSAGTRRRNRLLRRWRDDAASRSGES